MKRHLKYRKWKKIIEKSGLFDVKYYLFTYSDVRQKNIEPIAHYIKHGAKEGRNPSGKFNTLFYLESNPDVVESKINPFVHYILHGKNEGREPMIKKIIREIRDNGFKSTVKKVKDKININIQNKLSIEKIKFDNTNESFIDYKEHEMLDSKLKTIAFYLPQFHPFPENDAWWGKGFTEWTNVAKAQPNFKGHYQPHLPIHYGFYDLRIPEIMIEQAKLAKNYGIHGFNFYYYWFDGKILMHKPFEILLEHKEIDINFCITWANENWTRRWDGQENDILIAQNHCDDDSTKFIESLYKYFEDERYIRIDNKPVLIIYRVDIIPNMKETVALWRNKVKEAGFDDLYLICSQTFGIKDPTPFGFDAAMEFPPHTAESSQVSNKVDITNMSFDGLIYDYSQVVNNACKKVEPDYKLFRTSMLSWDNTARKQNNSHIFANFSLLKYKQWFSSLASNVCNNNKYNNDEKLVFINAWNEWAEGTHLEPDRKFGYGYLESTYDVIRNFDNQYFKLLSQNIKKNNDIAVILHMHYTDIWYEIEEYLKNLNSFGFDLYVTITNTDNNIIKKIIEKYPKANIKLVENRGRDILPFIDTFKEINELDYSYVCKVHSKKSEYRKDGDNIRNELYTSLLGNKEIIKTILEIFSETRIGMVCNKKYMIDHAEHNMTYDTEITNDLARVLGFKFEYSKFPAGSMFWFKPQAFYNINRIERNYFDIEEGLIDGTTAHAIERLFGLLCIENNLKIKEI